MAAGLSIWARSDGLAMDDIERARDQERSIVRTWLMRGTLHMATASDLGWLLPLLGPRSIHTTRRRYRELGLDERTRRRSLGAIQEILSRQTQLTRSELMARLAERGFPTSGQAAYHLVHHAGLSGLVCYGPERDGQETFVLLAEWAQVGKALPEDEALAELARRYLEAYAPAGPEDLARWSGLTVTKSRAAFEALATKLVEVESAQGPLWLLRRQRKGLKGDVAGDANVRLLPRYDTYLLGYRDRDLAVPPAFAKRVHPGGGILHAVVLVDGLAAGIWKTERTKAKLEVVIEPFERLEDGIISKLQAQVQDLARFLGTEAHPKVHSR
jgi:hypothetical protein